MRKAAVVLGLTIMAVMAVVAQGGRSGVWWGARYRFERDTRHEPTRHRPHLGNSMERLHHWNKVTIDASGLDHTPVQPGETRVFGEQLGPTRASRAMAIVHIAMFDAMNAIAGDYDSYADMPPAPPGTSIDAAIGQAAHDTLVALFPSQRAAMDQRLADDLVGLPESSWKINGVHVGKRAAAYILRMRAHDGSDRPDPFIGVDFVTSDAPGKWREDPVSQIPRALGAYWGDVRPFVIPSAQRFRVPPPPALNSPEYAEAYDETKRLGGDGILTPTERTPDQTEAGIFWAYDGTPSLGAPPRLYNQVAVQIGDERGLNAMQMARMLALVNVAMADAGIAIWESKYHYNFWRPVTGIREADPGTGPTGLGDGNDDTVADPTFSPFGGQASNLLGPNFTPPFPAYPSGHAGFGGALFQVLRRFYGTDDIAFTFVSDELNGMTRDNAGVIRPYAPRYFQSLSDAEEENGQSRIYLGIHWAFDKTDGIEQGRRVGNYVITHAFGASDR